jgi:hypothetical protein
MLSLSEKIRGLCGGFWFGCLVFGVGSLALARQVLYCLSHADNPFCFGYFSERVSAFA